MNKMKYETFIKEFSSSMVEEQFVGCLDSGINVCVEICDRYASTDKIALRYERADGSSGEMSFKTLKNRSAQFANYLYSQGIGKGDRVAGLLPRTPELLITIVGTLRVGAVYQPLFTAFGGDAIEYRLNQANTKLIVTNSDQWPKLGEIEVLPKTLLIADSDDHYASEADALFDQAQSNQSDQFEPVLIGKDDPFLQMFTSGTTGKSKGVSIPAKALIPFWIYMTYAIELRPDDRFWNVADPGWAYGLYYAVVGPLLLGCTTHFNEQGFTADNTFKFLQDYRITNLAAAPTAYRLLMANENQLAEYAAIHLRVASSAGEPLNPEVISWVQRSFGCSVKDQYGQTETGMTSANFHALDHEERTACMGYPLPGYRLVALDDQLNEVGPGETGELAVDLEASPQFFFQGYTWEEKNPFRGKYYLTGDIVISHGDGSHSYAGRDDDIIASSGYRIGPVDVESSLLKHPAVTESAVVGKPDKKRGSIIKAYVVIKPEYEAGPMLMEELQQFVRQHLSAHAFPREIEFLDELPKTSSGKLQRFLLRQRAAAEERLEHLDVDDTLQH